MKVITSDAGTRKNSTESQPLVRAEHLSKSFPVDQDWRGRVTSSLSAVDDVNLEISRGEVLSLVGETGSGKSTLGRLMIRLLAPTEGHLYFDGMDLEKLSRDERRRIRRRMQIIFQDPYSSLDPRMKVSDIVAEGMHPKSDKTKEQRVRELLDLVGLAGHAAARYPHEFSGGQRQRICIARALAVQPDFIVADEPVSALDVSVQAQILNLLRELQRELHLTYLFIAHDLSVVRHVSNRVAVMYLGKIVELASKDQLYKRPLHPYTQALLSAVPTIDGSGTRQRITLQGEIPSPIDPPRVCRFANRCFRAIDKCRQEEPPLEEVEPGHWVACFNYKPLDDS